MEDRAASLFRGSRILGWCSDRANAFSFFKRPPAGETISSLGKWLLCLLVFLCVFMPRISIGSLASAYSVDLRSEDLLLLLLVVLFFIRHAQKSPLPEALPVEKFFLGFLLAAEVSILNGFLMRTIDKPFLSLLYLLKWAEYFLVFVVTVRFTGDQKVSDFFLKSFFLLGAALACYGYWEHFFLSSKAVYPNYYRLFERAPFHGDANHVGGLFVLWIGFFTGLFLEAKTPRRWGFLLAALLFVFFPFIWTYSRKSYFALGGVLVFSFAFLRNRKKLLVLACLFVILGLLLPTRLSERVRDLGEAFTSTDPYHSSWAGNLSMWQQSLWNFKQFFLFGSGLGSRHRLFYESQYVLVLAETGIFGFSLFSLLCLRIFRGTVGYLRRPLESQERGVVSGYLLGFLGLLIHNLSCVSLTVSKIAIPFWFLTAAVLIRFKETRAVSS